MNVRASSPSSRFDLDRWSVKDKLQYALLESWSSVRYWSLICRRNALSLERISTHLKRSEKLKLFELASARGGVWVEIGSYLGASAAVLGLAASAKAAGSAMLYCVDTWENDAMSEGARQTFAEFQRNTAAFASVIRPLKGSSVQVARSFEQRIDLLFIDGDHSYEGVLADIEAWFPKVNAGGVVIFHDIGWAKGVQAAVQERILPFVRETGRLPNLFWATK